MHIIFTSLTNILSGSGPEVYYLWCQISIVIKIKWDVTLFNVAHLYLSSIIIFWHNPYTHWSKHPSLEWVYKMGSCSPSLTPFPLAMGNSKAKSNGWCLVSVPKSVMYLCRSLQKLCMVEALCTPIISASGAIAAVTKVQCLCDVSCCLATHLDMLQGSFSGTDLWTLIKFCMLLGKSSLESYKLLKEQLGTHVSSYEMGKCH